MRPAPDVVRSHAAPRITAPLAAGLAATLVVLIVHALVHRSLTDDAFISFRYARNLASGHGLVWNPGFERVEGYSNFLWVLVLAAFARLGLPPEVVADPLSLVATAMLWLAVAWFALRLASDGRRRWAALTAPLALALNRSVAVWSTSGLETRAFELLLTAGALRWVVELEAWRDRRPRRPLAPWFFALACWTRPDGLVPVAVALGVGALWLGRAGRLEPRRLAMAWLPCAGLIGAHFLFRRIYYGDWLPNTYYAKVGGLLWWSAGGAYLAAFALEYALWLWVPLALAGAAALGRRGQGLTPLLFAGIVLPHVLYVAAVGGDYFEYRLLDLVFPFLFLLAGEGVRWIAGGPAGRGGTGWALAGALGLAAMLALAWDLPWQSHVQFPTGTVVGFPGRMLESSREAREFLDPARSPIYRWPGLSGIAEVHRRQLDWLTRHFVDIRAEEHARFAREVVPEGRKLRDLVDRGVLPRDLYVAMGAVGAIPYYSDLRVLDMQGLTDAKIARSGPSRVSSERLMAHDRSLDWGDAVARGVDLIAVDAHPLLELTSDAMLSEVRDAAAASDSAWAADVGGGFYLVAQLPRGPAATAARIPGLRFESLTDPRFLESFVARSIAAWRESLEVRPDLARARLRLAWLELVRGDVDAARGDYRAASVARPDQLEAWDGLAWCEARLGHREAARAALARAVELARAQEDMAHLGDLERRLAELGGPSGR